jgi:hypothetical protein
LEKVGVTIADLEEDPDGEDELGFFVEGEGVTLGVKTMEEGLGGMLGFAPMGLVVLDAGIVRGVEQKKLTIAFKAEREKGGHGKLRVDS